ncbi:unnamed protein product, partial [Brassica rapa subsp. narinosa]
MLVKIKDRLSFSLCRESNLIIRIRGWWSSSVVVTFSFLLFRFVTLCALLDIIIVG